MHFSDRLAATIKQKNSCLMLGLDPNWDRIKKLRITSDELRAKATSEQKAKLYQQFCCEMVDACAPYICGVKIQMGYFEALGSVGVKAVENLIAYTRTKHPALIIMMDAKRGDIGSTSEAYAEAFLGADSRLAGDCVTVAPYMGTDSLDPFFALAEKNNKGTFVLLKTSNPSSTQIQDLPLKNGATVAEFWGQNIAKISPMVGGGATANYSSVGFVVGATHAEQLATWRQASPKNWLLCPGVGAQGGKLEDVLAIRDKNGLGVLIPISRSVLYASDGADYLEATTAEIKKLWERQKL